MSPTASYIPHRVSFSQKIKIKFFRLFRLRRGPCLKLYTGFGNADSCTIYGHALSLCPLPRKRYRRAFWINSLALLRMFMVKPMKGATVKLLWDGAEWETVTQKDGFFKFEWKHSAALRSGSYPVKALLMKKNASHKTLATAEAEVIVPSSTQFAFISDIDDTFLVSHSTNLRKRLFVLLTENARSRRPFEGAVNHYRALHGIDDHLKEDNAFFYVSSSEWNLHDYIREFVRQNRLPEGVFLLNQLKTFSKLFSTGQGNHDGKFFRIVRILEAYPQQVFVLLGDDSQKDIDIYSSVIRHFPKNIYCVYIRRVRTPEKPHVREMQKEIEKAGVRFFYFAHSDEAIAHSKSIGLISI